MQSTTCPDSVPTPSLPHFSRGLVAVPGPGDPDPAGVPHHDGVDLLRADGGPARGVQRHRQEDQQAHHPTGGHLHLRHR